MSVLTEQQLWLKILEQAELDESIEYFRLVRPEFKRSILFVRKSQELEIPEEVIHQVRLSAAAFDYQLRVTSPYPTMADLKLAVGDVTFLWRDWIPNGFITLLAGEAKTGKSKLAQWLCKIVIEGGQFPDGSRYETPGHVIYIDAEGSQILASNSTSDMGVDLTKIHIPNFSGDMLGQPDLNNESHKEQLVKMVQDLRPRMVVIDSLGGVKSGGENRKEEMQPTMLFLNHLAQEYQFAVVIITHLNKTKREEDEEIAIGHVRGSSAIVQFSRSILFLSRKPKGLKFWIGGSNVTNFPEIGPINCIPLYGEREKEGRTEKFVQGYEFEDWVDEVKTTKIEECQKWVKQHLVGCSGYHDVSRNIFELGDESWTTRTIKEAGAILERKGEITRSGGRNSIWQLLQPDLLGHNNGHERRIEVLESGEGTSSIQSDTTG